MWLSIASSGFPQGSPSHIGSPFLTASHTNSGYSHVLRINKKTGLWHVSQSALRSDFLTSREEMGGGTTTLTSHLSPPWAGFSTEDFMGVMVCGGYLLRVCSARDNSPPPPPPANKHISHLSAKNHKHKSNGSCACLLKHNFLFWLCKPACVRSTCFSCKCGIKSDGSNLARWRATNWF